MKNAMKQQLINDVLTGLLVAATLSLGMPVDALAQTLSAAGTNAQTNVMIPFVKFASYASYGMGTVMLVSGIAATKAHADSPSSNKLAPALGKLGAGSAFLAAPTVAGFLAGTSNAVTGGGTAGYQGIGGF